MTAPAAAVRSVVRLMIPISRYGMLLAVLCGCVQPPAPKPAPPTPPVADTPTPAPASAPATAATPQPPAITTGRNDPAEVERRAREQARAIEALLAGQNAPATTEPDTAPPAPPLPTERPKPAALQPPSPPPAPPSVSIAEVPPAPSGDVVANAGTPPPPAGDQIARAAPPVPPGPARSREGDLLARRIEAAARLNPRDTAAQLDQQLLGLLQGRSVPTAETLGALAPDDREMLSTLVDGLANFRAAVVADGNMLMTRKIRPLLDMSDRLRAASDLSIPTATLCSDIKAFGLYTPIDPPRFPALTPTRFYVYVEVANFSSKLNSGNLYVTNLHQDLVLYTETGLAVKTLSSSNVADVSRTRRHDFFLRTAIDLPATLTTGRHVLKVTIVDQNASHVAETTVPLAIVAK